jgi:hypothetical protein
MLDEPTEGIQPPLPNYFQIADLFAEEIAKRSKLLATGAPPSYRRVARQ